MNYDTVEAQEVMSGDRIFGYGKWHRVKEVRRSGENVVIETTAWSTWKHPREGVARIAASMMVHL